MSKINSANAIILSLLLLGAGACADRKNISPRPTISHKAKADLEAPVNCSSAEQDLEVLRSERASTGKKMLSGARSILPITAAAGILMGDYRDRVRVATGQYNSDLDAKIRQIETVCSVHGAVDR